jgi:hypothetical protein
MKTNVLKFFAMLLLLAGCQEQIELIEPQEVNLLTEALTDDDLEMNDQGIPAVVFRTTNKGKHKIVVRDNSVVPDENGKTVLTISSKDNHGGSEHLTLNFGKIDTQYSIPYSPSDNGYEGSVITIDMQYFDSKGSLVQSHQYDAYVDEKGKTALQAPALGSPVAITTGKVNDDGTVSGGHLILNFPVINDPAGQVADMDLLINSTKYRPIKRRTKGGFVVDIDGIEAFLPRIINIDAVMTDKFGQATGEPVNTDTEIQKADFTGRVRRIRIREQQGGTSFRTAVVLDGNSASSIVEHIDLMIKTENGVIGQVAYPTARSIENDENGGTTYVVKDVDDLLKTDKAYSVTAILMGFDGKPVSAVTEYVVVERPCCGRIHRIRIRENNSGTNFRIIVNENVDPTNEPASYVQVKFNDTYGNPAPIPEIAILTLANPNPEKAINTYLYKPLTFEGKAKPIETKYNITATMLRADGSPIGEPFTTDVIVESNKSIDEESEPDIVSSRIISADKGATWKVEIKLRDPEPWTQWVEVAFVKPVEGPAPLSNILKLLPGGKEEGGVIAYTGEVKFNGDPYGFAYTMMVANLGIGTRNTASQAKTKAELL